MSAQERRSLLLDAADQVFATRGYAASSVDAIVSAAGVTPPVLYDHFASKAELYAELVDRHYGSLREIWTRHASSGLPGRESFAAAVDEWFAYVDAHPFAARMLFDEATGDRDASAAHSRIEHASRAEVLDLLRTNVSKTVAAKGGLEVEMRWEILRSVLQGLARWWSDHPQVPRAQVVDAALAALWPMLSSGGMPLRDRP